MKFIIFIKRDGCLKCHEVLEYCKALHNLELQIYDLDTVDGLAEASYYGVLSTPTIIEIDDEGEKINRYLNLKDFISEVKRWSRAREPGESRNDP